MVTKKKSINDAISEKRAVLESERDTLKKLLDEHNEIARKSAENHKQRIACEGRTTELEAAIKALEEFA